MKRGRKKSKYAIEKDIPINYATRTNKSEEYKTLDKLKIGESFTFPLEVRSIINGAIGSFRRNGPKRFTFRTISKTPAKGRIWRVEDNMRLRTRRKLKTA